jgi:hypothetical protein
MKTNHTSHRRIDRREAIKWVMTVAAGAAVADPSAFGASTRGVYGPGTVVAGTGYGTDPNVIKIYKPGMVWDLTLTDDQMKTVAALCDVIIPADDKSPAASAVAVPEFIAEWISAPYPEQVADRKVVLEGLVWLEQESQKRFKKGFADLNEEQKHNLCDDICHSAKAKPEFKKAATFFSKFRSLTAGGFYTTPKGMKDIGYVGNMPVKEFKGPPPEVRKKLGV